jgi:hypothetical protein
MTILRPGSIVVLKTKIEGGVSYSRTDLAADASGDGAAVERWETVKVTEDPEEHARAVKVRGKAGNTIARICSKTAFGLLCSTQREGSLAEAIDEARAMVAAFNGTANCTRLYLYVLQARIAETEGEAARAIASELRDILATMQEGIASADAVLVRKAANKAKQLGGMLDASAGAIVTRAIDEARAVAKEIVKRAKDQGDAVAAYIDTVDLKAISEARFAFLDMEAPIAPTGDVLPAVDARGLDLDGEDQGEDASDGEDQADGASYQARGLDLDGAAIVAVAADSVGVRYEV